MKLGLRRGQIQAAARLSKPASVSSLRMAARKRRNSAAVAAAKEAPVAAVVAAKAVRGGDGGGRASVAAANREALGPTLPFAEFRASVHRDTGTKLYPNLI